jgi:hypothetical protein
MTDVALVLRRKGETWVYDDPEFGVVDEPVSLSAEPFVTRLRHTQLDRKYKAFRVVLSDTEMDNAGMTARLVISDSDGAVYYFKVGGWSGQGWLCAHLYDYFPGRAPLKLWARAEAV